MIWLWIGFIVFVLALLALDLGVVHRRAGVTSAPSALRWVTFFIALALAFNASVYFIYERDWFGFGSNFAQRLRDSEAHRLVLAGRLEPAAADSWAPAPGSPVARAIAAPGRTAAVQFLAGWLTEYALSVDNIFVIAVIFSHFRVPPSYQHRVLFWGILGALVMRGVMILGGTALLAHFHWLLYLFGAFLIFTAARLAFGKEDKEADFADRRIVRWTSALVPISPDYDGQKFFTRLAGGGRAATPLLLVLLIVEATDLIFALDSIPAILGITADPFLVFTSNVFAVLGLRSLFFALSRMIGGFAFLRHSLAAILGFVGLKMIAEMPFIDIQVSSGVSLAFIVAALVTGIVASLVRRQRSRGR